MVLIHSKKFFFNFLFFLKKPTISKAQSKWVSENLIFEARNRGVPVTIIRPGYIVGHSRTGGFFFFFFFFFFF